MNPAEDYIFNQPELYRSMLMHIKAVVEHTLPEAELLYKYRIPFFYLFGKPCCYLNHSKDYVDVGFWDAAHLTLYQEHMVTEGRKMMKSLRYKTLEEINDKVLVAILKNAEAVKYEKIMK